MGRAREKRTYEFFDDALVDEEGNCDSEKANKGEVATSPAKVVLEILSSRAPLFYEPILVSLHSSSHFPFSSVFLRSSLGYFLCFSLQGSRWYRFVMLPIYKPTVWLRGLPCSERILATFWLQRQGCSCYSVNSLVPFGTKSYTNF